MASINAKPVILTHEGAPAKHISPYLQLRRSIMSCLLWENTFYEDGKAIADRIAELVTKVPQEQVLELILEAKEKMRLRHTPLYLTALLANLPEGRVKAGYALSKCVTRPDDLTEFLSLYWKDGKKPIAKQIKIALADAFKKFDEYELAKYNGGKKAIKLRDVLLMVHPKPEDDAQSALWKRLINNELTTPDTWEVALSAGADKKETWLRLINTNKIGGLALLRNLRNMVKAGLSKEERREAIKKLNPGKLLPINFLAASAHDVENEDILEEKFLECFSQGEKLKGKTMILVDVSGSMSDKLSAKSEMRRIDVACALAMIAREKFEETGICAFSDSARILAPRRGFALRDAIISVAGGGTRLGASVAAIAPTQYERIVVITDEQSFDPLPDPIPGSKGYMINVASNKNGVGYGRWTHIDGWSDAVIQYVEEFEKMI